MALYVSTHPSPANISPTNMHVSMGSTTMFISRVTASPFFASNEGSFLSFFFADRGESPASPSAFRASLYARLFTVCNVCFNTLVSFGTFGTCTRTTGPTALRFPKCLGFGSDLASCPLPAGSETKRLLQFSVSSKTHTFLNDISAHVNEIWEVEIVGAISSRTESNRVRLVCVLKICNVIKH